MPGAIVGEIVGIYLPSTLRSEAAVGVISGKRSASDPKRPPSWKRPIDVSRQFAFEDGQ